MRLVLTLALAILALGLLPATSAAATPYDARTFVDSIGVNTHLFYDDTAYANFAMVKQRLQELGVRHIRDGFDPGRRQWFYDRVNSLGAAGIKSTLITCQLATNQGSANLDGYVADAKNKIRPSLDALEGVNEPPQARFHDAKECQYWLYRLANDGSYGAPLDKPILGPSVDTHLADEFGSIADFGNPGATTANFHPYPGGRNPSGPGYYPFAQQADDIRRYQFPGRSVPIQATETGYHDATGDPTTHPSISQEGEAIYLPRLFLEYARADVERSFTYELVDQFPDPERDEREKNFGLFENDWSYKPAAHALKNTIGLLDSPSASPQAPLGYTLSNTADPDGAGTGGAVKDRLFQKADGSWWLALWQDSSVWDVNARQDISNPSITVGVQLDRTLTATGYRPTQGTGTYGSVRASSFNASVGDDVLLIKLTG